MKIAIAGCSGFIGSNLVQALSAQYEILQVDQRVPGWQATISQANVLINLVGKAHDHSGKATEADYYAVNIDLLRELFAVFEVSESTTFIHFSSIAAVEEFGADEVLHEATTCNPKSFYGKSKREAELFLLEKIDSGSKKIVILRPPMIHGKGDKGNLRNLYKFLRRGLPYPLGAFNNQRSLLSVNNLIFFINEILEKEKNLDSGIYHIADDEPLSTKEMVHIARYAMNQRSVDFTVPASIIRLLAKIGDAIPFPLNSKRLAKMTSSLVISTKKIKTALKIKELPFTSKEGLISTIKHLEKES